MTTTSPFTKIDLVGEDETGSGGTEEMKQTLSFDETVEAFLRCGILLELSQVSGGSRMRATFYWIGEGTAVAVNPKYLVQLNGNLLRDGVARMEELLTRQRLSSSIASRANTSVGPAGISDGGWHTLGVTKRELDILNVIKKAFFTGKPESFSELVDQLCRR